MENTFPTRLKISKLLNSILVFRQLDGTDFFVAAPKAIVIGIRSFTMILHFLVMREMLDHRILEGILEDYHGDKGKNRNEKDTNNSSVG